MRVVFLNYNIYGVGGTVRTTVNLANELSRRGWDVSIISVRRTSTRPVLDVDPDVAIDPLIDVRNGRGRASWHTTLSRITNRTHSILIHPDEDLYRNYSLLSDVKLVERIRRLRECVLVTTTPSMNLLATRFAHHSVTTVGQEHKVFKSHSDAIQRQIAHSYGKLHGLQCITEEAAHEYHRLLSDSATNVRFIPNGTSLEPLTGVRRPVIVAAGHLDKNKGMDRIIRAFASIADRDPKWRLEIYGKGEEAEDLGRLVIDLGVHNEVFLCGETASLTNVLATSSVFALGSYHESFGMVLIEAMAQSLPCVAFDSEGPRALIDHGRTGAIAAQNDIKAFSHALHHLMTDPLRRTEFGIAARASVARYDIRLVCEHWMQWVSALHSSRQRSARVPLAPASACLEAGG